MTDSSINIRLATTTDCQSLNEINSKSLPIAYTKNDYAMFISSNKHFIIVAEINNKLVGYCLVEKFGKRNHIMSIAVSEEHRKHGIAQLMINKFISDHKEINRITLYVHVENEVAISFYKKNGFSVETTLDKYYNDIPHKTSLDAYYMVKRL